MEIQESIVHKRNLIDAHLEKLIPLVEGPHGRLFEAARYSLLLPGKRLRPLLTLAVLEDYGVPIQEGLDAASALELVHTYSLIHDDLPCMDNDDFRRGKPTLHRVYGEGHAVLTGDFLLTRAFEVLAKEPELLAILASRAGGEGLIGGQVVDLLSEGEEIDWERLEFMYKGKTAALFSAALEFGAVIAESSDEDRAALKRAGECFGIAFQIRDDISDGTSSDLIKQKATALTLFGRERAEELAASFLEEALSSLTRELPTLEKIFRG
ncbi:MAG: Farnesyl diphosphate synthase [Chlamydiae bacterium]|nr:Farnesyl diphosphate synthase [Chlamydiota bacterium]